MATKKKSAPRSKPVRRQGGDAISVSRGETLHYAMPLLVFGLTFLCFLPSLQNGFVNRDDAANFLDNPYYRGLGWSQLRWMFSTFHLFNYRPLTWVSFGADYLLWGMDPFGYHLTSLLLHAANALVFYFLSLRLLALGIDAPAVFGGGILRLAAGISALLFAIHPLRVQTVAWLSARNHLLSSLFFLLTVLCYLRATTDAAPPPRQRRSRIAAIFFYALSLLSQPSGIMLPLVLWLIDIYPLKRLSGGPVTWFGREGRRLWPEKIPFLVLAFLAGLMGIFVKQGVAFEEFGVARRLALALYGLASYGWKTLIPIGLSPIYELPGNFDPSGWRFLLSGLLVFGVSIVLYIYRRQWPAGLAGWVYYTLMLIPYVTVLVPVLTGSDPTITLNELEVGADRYSYLACLPWAALAGAAFVCGWRFWLARRRSTSTFSLTCSPIVAMLIISAALTWEQTRVWKDSETLWRRILKVNPSSSIAYNNVGNGLLMRGETEQAIDFYRTALKIEPRYADAHFDLATALIQTGKLESAIEEFRAGLGFDPENSKAHYYLGRAYAQRGQLEEAIAEFRRSLALAPAQSVVQYDLGTALAIKGDLDGAADHFRRAISLQPDYGQAHLGLGRILAGRGLLRDATQEFREAVRLAPELSEARASLSRALALQAEGKNAAQHNGKTRAE